MYSMYWQFEHYFQCPCNLQPDQLSAPPSELVVNGMGNLLIYCTHNCGQVVQLQNLDSHLKSRIDIPPPSAITVEQLLARDPDREPSLMVTHNMGLLAERMFPSGTYLTYRSSTGKVIY